MEITPDVVVYFRIFGLPVNATLVYTWGVMAFLTGFSAIVTRRLEPGTDISGRQNLLEVIVEGLHSQVAEVTRRSPERFLPFLGTLFIFIAVSNVLAIVPGFRPPTGSLSTTTALALCVFFAVPIFGVAENGVGGYFRKYFEPTPLMLPFNIMGEITRTFALAVRLFGNIMSGQMLGAILLVIAPLFFPVIMQLLGLLIGLVQAYIFTILAGVFIAAGLEAHDSKQKEGKKRA